MTTNNTPKSDVPFVEAPASWNTRYLTPDGFECQLTLRGETGQEVLERAQGAIAFLLKNSCLPCVSTRTTSSARVSNNIRQTETVNANHNGFPWENGDLPGGNGNGNGHDRSWCPIHECQMKRWDKAGDLWCKGKDKYW